MGGGEAGRLRGSFYPSNTLDRTLTNRFIYLYSASCIIYDCYVRTFRTGSFWFEQLLLNYEIKVQSFLKRSKVCVFVMHRIQSKR